MSSSKDPPTPNWRTHPLAQKILQSFSKQDLTGPSATSMRVNAVYYPNWKIYNQLPPSSLDLKYITHVYYAFALYVFFDILLYSLLLTQDSLKPDGTVYVATQ